jgi:pimeloyl-ACP methyl ester carboxylesterase
VTHDEYRSLKETLDTPSGRFTYLDVGEGDPVVFIHGLFMSGFFWHRVVDEIKGERRCVVYNLPFHGGSTGPQEGELDLDTNVALFAEFCDALGLDSFDLVANDTGGAFAQGFAVTQPERVRTLTLTNCEARDWMPSHDDLAQLVTQLAEQRQLAPALVAAYEDLDAARKGPLAEPYQFPDRMSDDEIHAIMEPHQATLEGARQLERFAASLRPEQLAALEPQLRELHVPIVLVWGTGDKIFPLELAEWLRDTVPGCKEIVEIDGGRLFWPFERGEELVPHLRRHWQQAAPA